jgi:Protein of unknown function (DUF2924)
MKRGVLKQVAELATLSHDALKQRWRDLYGTAPPSYNRVGLLKRLAYRVQELSYGGLSEETRRRLREFIPPEQLDGEDAEVARAARRRRRDGIPVIGTLLVREWHGTRYEVTVVWNGFEYEGCLYRSLTAVARAITGTHLNGPQFFGLRRLERRRAR